jgi:hypothetical protein
LVPAELLAQKERKNRVMVPNAGCINAAYKFQEDGNVRPWGGINQVFVGDFYQLPPSYGKTSLASVPCDLFTRMQHLLQNASALYGINLMWNCVTHLVELEEMIRCKDDAWYVDVLTQMRKGALCEDYWAYIHGKDTTTKPGSFVYAKETVLCGNDECIASWTESRTECKVCKAHRKSRALVAYGPEDARYDLPQFQNSKNLMSFNDNRCDVGQRRAQRRARETTQRVAYVICEDKTSDEELKRDPKLADKKAQWAKSRPADQTAAYGVRNHKKLLLAYLMQLFTTDLMVQTNFNFDHVFLCSIFFKSFFYYLGHILGEKKSAQILILSTPIDRKTMFPVDWCVQIIFLLF